MTKNNKNCAAMLLLRLQLNSKSKHFLICGPYFRAETWTKIGEKTQIKETHVNFLFCLNVSKKSYLIYLVAMKCIFWLLLAEDIILQKVLSRTLLQAFVKDDVLTQRHGDGSCVVLSVQSTPGSPRASSIWRSYDSSVGLLMQNQLYKTHRQRNCQ